jgi:ATP-dependent DNA helicase RecQ
VLVMDAATDAAARDLLRRIAGDANAEPRPGQLEAIAALVDDRQRVLVVQRTGWGKSAVYFIATRLLRDQGAGASLLISPLLALMRNQIAMAERSGVRAATINSENRDDWAPIESAVRQGKVDLLLISPERLNNPRFRAEVLPHLVDTVGMLIVDEAHCISDWGHDFRPDYRRVASVLDLLPSGVPVLCTTATANQRVIDDVVSQLGDDLTIVRGTLDRESLALSVRVLPNPAERLAWLAQVIPTLPGSGIVYCLTVRDTELVAGWLQDQGISAAAYSGESELTHRLEVEAAFEANEIKVVVATSALGMGYDKPDVAFVIHYQSPGSPIAYYQQVGRAGRALARSDGVLLVGNEDVDIQDYFIRSAFPTEEQATTVLDLLEGSRRPLSTRAILPDVNLGQTRLEGMLKVLEVEGAVERVPGSGWVRTPEPWGYDGLRVERVTAARRAEQSAMAEYVRTDGCRMQFLRAQLDDPVSLPCGRCDRCTEGASSAEGATRATPDVEIDRALVVAAREHVRALPIVLEPRKQWMAGVADLPGRIPADQQLSHGRALAVFADGGWGDAVRDARRGVAPIPDELIDAAAAFVTKWAPDPAPRWVTWVPNGPGREVSSDAARRLAAALGLPAVEAVTRWREMKPQAEMANSAMQLGNVHGSFEIAGELPKGPVLLVDDVADSRWTLTVVGAALRETGSGPVHPFVLATTRS